MSSPQKALVITSKKWCKLLIIFHFPFSSMVSAPGSISLSSPSSISSENQMDEELNVLQKHVTFFDRNKDGVIYPWETFQGLRAIGCGLALSTIGAIFINLSLSGKTRPGKFPSLLFPIQVKNITRAKHGSDSGAYDKEGRFVSSKFEDLFLKHSHTNSNALTAEEVSALLKANREPNDFGGRLGAWAEWKVLYYLCKDENGLLHKETIRAVYDGSLFEQMEKNKNQHHK